MPNSDGYVQELDYTHGYCREIAPAHIRLACLAQGVDLPITDRPMRYLEMAFGQGVSVNIHAAACPGEYWGFDFNPKHAAHARNLAQASGATATLSDDSFESFLARSDLPAFDLITLHGTWSWISRANRHLVVEILRRHLAPGGAFCLSYNSLPGWATEIPLRHLLVQHAMLSDEADRPLAARIDAALDFARAAQDAGAGFFRAHPGAAAWLERDRKSTRLNSSH